MMAGEKKKKETRKRAAKWVEVSGREGKGNVEEILYILGKKIFEKGMK